MHVIIAEDDNLIVFTNNHRKIVDCFEFQRLTFTGNLKNILKEEKGNDDLRFAMEEDRQ